MIIMRKTNAKYNTVWIYDLASHGGPISELHLEIHKLVNPELLILLWIT
jgi:hypothetical protein